MRLQAPQGQDLLPPRPQDNKRLPHPRLRPLHKPQNQQKLTLLQGLQPIHVHKLQDLRRPLRGSDVDPRAVEGKGLLRGHNRQDQGDGPQPGEAQEPDRGAARPGRPEDV